VIYPREIRIARQTYRWPAEPEMATGSRCTGDACQTASAGEIRLGSARPDSALQGTLTLRFGPTEVISGVFRAVWRPTAASVLRVGRGRRRSRKQLRDRRRLSMDTSEPRISS
jgi:hypothetical protein